MKASLSGTLIFAYVLKGGEKHQLAFENCVTSRFLYTRQEIDHRETKRGGNSKKTRKKYPQHGNLYHFLQVLHSHACSSLLYAISVYTTHITHYVTLLLEDTKKKAENHGKEEKRQIKISIIKVLTLLSLWL